MSATWLVWLQLGVTLHFRTTLEPYVQAFKACRSVVSAPSDSGSWSDLGAILHQVAARLYPG